MAGERTFFATTIPGFEGLLNSELSDLQCPPGGKTLLEGGVEFKGRLQSCYEANLKLRTAHRILMRIAGFKATNFRALQKKTEALSWALHLPPGRPLQIRVASKHSRLYHTAALEECIRKAINTRLAVAATQQNPSSLGESPLVFVRLHKDFFSLSVDSSGDLLHRRGIKSYPAKAPIRETIAAAALLFAGYDGKRPLLDPMCGSGTFSFKAAMMARNMPPGWFRDFAFMNSGLP
ncbi:MAG: THUMP domain-containing class I SAM-dependent RNA methyltransferase [Desulfatiglandales bacterium]